MYAKAKVAVFMEKLNIYLQIQQFPECRNIKHGDNLFFQLFLFQSDFNMKSDFKKTFLYCVQLKKLEKKNILIKLLSKENF